MATCKWCGKSGLFLTVSQKGLCKTCDIVITMELQQKAERLNESTDIIKFSSNTDTILSRFDYIVSLYTSLVKYEQKGIDTLKVPPSRALSEVYTPIERDNHIIYGLEQELEKLKSALGDLKTKQGRDNRVKKFYLRCQEFKKELNNPSTLAEIEDGIEKLQNWTDDTLEKLGGLID